MNKQKGFTLVELMVVLAIIGMLAAIAYPNYQDRVRKSRRADATGALTGFANAMERHFTERGGYCDVGAGAAVANCGTATFDTGVSTIFPTPEGTKNYYTLTISAVSPSSYTLSATPIGTQANNDICGTLTLTNTGVRGTSSATVAECW